MTSAVKLDPAGVGGFKLILQPGQFGQDRLDLILFLPVETWMRVLLFEPLLLFLVFFDPSGQRVELALKHV